jgi:two-component system cell cycle sensor histidine kinase/response regulator CckA
MTARTAPRVSETRDLARRLAEAEATIEAMLSGQIDAVVDSKSQTPILLAKAQDALRESEARYRRIIETTNQGVWHIDAEHRTTFMNRRMAQMLGCEADMGVGRSPFDFMDEAGRVEMRASLGMHRGQQVETRYVRDDGSTFWGLVESTHEYDLGGAYRGSFAMVMDITERRLAQAALQASEARFRCLWESGVILITVSELNGTIREVNDYGVRLLGYTREELTSSIGLSDLTPAEWRAADDVAMAELLATGVAVPWEKELIRRDGTRVPILAARAMLDGTVAMSIGIDLTKRKRAEKDLLERMRIATLTGDIGLALAQEEGVRTILDQCGRAIVRDLDVALVRIWTVDAATRGLELGASVGLFSEPGAAHDRFTAGSLELGVAQTREAYLNNDLRRDFATDIAGWEGICAFAGLPLLVNDELVGVLAVFGRETISEAAFMGLDAISDALAVGIHRHMMSSANLVLESQLRQSQKMEAVGRLAGGIAHDFNNILSVILSCSEFLLDDLQPRDPARADVQEISKAGLRAADLTRQLLMFSRQQVLEPRILDLGKVTTDLDGMLRRVLGEDVELVLRTQPRLGCVRVDPGSIEQVIMNLVVNARDAMPTGGTLTIEIESGVAPDTLLRQSVAPAAAYAVLSVTDTGTGMDLATQARIFEPFFTTKDVGKGTGLGLSTVFGIVQQSNGAIRVRSEPGGGTTFRIFLPQVEDSTLEPAAPMKSALRGSETIMLVEDEDQVRLVARAILHRSGYRVIEMRTAAEALLHCQASAEPVHLLVTDVVMPRMSGPELARRLAVIRPGLKVLCMSGYTDDSVMRHGVMKADIAFLQKPFTTETLTRKVREVLDAPATSGSALPPALGQKLRDLLDR